MTIYIASSLSLSHAMTTDTFKRRIGLSEHKPQHRKCKITTVALYNIVDNCAYR
jgi:hypothetical protein